MDNNNGEENAQNQHQQMAILQEDEDGISVPNWLMEVLAWISRVEMANSSLSYSCKLFKLLCWPKLHENVMPHKIYNLEYSQNWRSISDSRHLKINPHGQRLPIPTVPPPSYILGFDRIYILLLDDQFVEFVKNILPCLNPINIYLDFGPYGWIRDDKKVKALGRLLDLLANKIVIFSFNGSAHIFEYNRLFPGFLQKVPSLSVSHSLSQTEFDIIFDWLGLPPPPNADKQQKIFNFFIKSRRFDGNETNKFIERIKKEFSCARAPLNFFIKFPVHFSIAHFNMENGKTGEILTAMEQWQIVRCPKGEENYWNKEGNKTNPEWIGHTKETRINFFVSL